MQVETFKTERMLALEVRPRWITFAMFETPERLLDWGMRKYLINRRELPRIATRKLTALLDLHDPSVIVVRTRTVRMTIARRRIAIIMRIVRQQAKKRVITLRTISTNSVKKLFARDRCRSKYQRALLIARQFPDLSWRLPPKQKIWKGEDHRLVMFDAVATALTFLNRSPPTDQ